MTADVTGEQPAGQSIRSLMPDRRMLGGTSVAFIGADGAGKTTVIDGLLQAWPEVSRYVYMGASIDRANYSLPTSRWMNRRKRRVLASTLEDPGVLPPAALLSETQKERLPRGRLFKAVGLVNRIAEEWYRQLVVWTLKARGYLVLCDRHFLFDYSPHRHRDNLPLSVRVHHWLLRGLFPRPNLVIFLDADPETLYERKPEWPKEHLQRQRSNILEQGRHVRGFVRVDASQPPGQVLGQVAELIVQTVEKR